MTAVREANQAGSLQPTTLVSYRAEIDDVFDGRDEKALQTMGMAAAALADTTWRNAMQAGGEARTQIFARELIASGQSGLLVRSFAAGSGTADFNLVLWRWGQSAASHLVVIDDEGRPQGRPDQKV